MKSLRNVRNGIIKKYPNASLKLGKAYLNRKDYFPSVDVH